MNLEVILVLNQSIHGGQTSPLIFKIARLSSHVQPMSTSLMSKLVKAYIIKFTEMKVSLLNLLIKVNRWERIWNRDCFIVKERLLLFIIMHYKNEKSHRFLILWVLEPFHGALNREHPGSPVRSFHVIPSTSATIAAWILQI